MQLTSQLSPTRVTVVVAPLSLRSVWLNEREPRVFSVLSTCSESRLWDMPLPSFLLTGPSMRGHVVFHIG